MNEKEIINYSWDLQEERREKIINKKQEHNTSYGKALASQYSNKLMEKLAERSSTRRNLYRSLISSDPKVLAEYVTAGLQIVLSQISQDPEKCKCNKIAITIAEAMIVINTKHGLQTTEDKGKLLQLGTEVLVALCDLGLITREHFKNPLNVKKNFYYVAPTEKTRDLIEYHNSLLIPRYLPSTQKPEDWNGLYKGNLIKIPLMIRREQEFKGMDTLYEPANILQQVPLKVDNFIYKVAEKAMEDNLELPSLPYTIEYDVPEYDGTKTWFNKKKNWKKKSARAFSKSYRAKQTMEIAKEYLSEEEIYFDMNYDSRARMYPLAQGLSPQGDDLSKSLLEFKNGRKLTESGLMWLKITIGMLWGCSDYKEAMDWTEANKGKLFDYVSKPLENLEWTKAEEGAWEFLKASMEYVTYLIDNDALIYGAGHLDGKNNALQHYSLLGRDSELAKYVGILDNETGLDYYELCSKHLQELCEMDSEDFKLYFGDLISSRGFIKTSAMVKTYGSTDSQIRNSIEDKLLEEDIDLENYNINLMVKRIKRAIEIATTIATDIMIWFNKCSKIIGDNSVWTTPDGVELKSDYHSYDLAHPEIDVNGVRYRMSFRSPMLNKNGDKKPNKHKIKNSKPANIIHSIDATHLRMIIKRLKALGVTDIMAIHDCVRVHYNDMSIAYRVARETAIELYSVDHLERFKSEWEERFNVTLPDTPEKGDLEIKSLKKSKGFFS